MLIHKGNLFKLVLAWLLLVAALARAAPMPAVAGRAPDVVAAEFYGWYLDTLVADQDPLSDRTARFNTYVAKALADQLVARLRAGPPPASDYFLQAAGYRDGWLRGQVHAAVVRRQARQADVVVTLGTGSAQRTLALVMVPEDGVWKIRRVSLADPESSTGPPIV